MQKLRQSLTTNTARGCIIAFAVVWLAISWRIDAIPLCFATFTLGDREAAGYFCVWVIRALFSLPSIAIGVGFLVWALRPIVAGVRLSKPVITVSNATPRVGEEVTFTYYQSFKRATDVSRILFQLFFRESARYRRGTDTYTVTHDQVFQQFEYPARRFETGETLNVRRDLLIPADAMHTFVAANNQLRWFVKSEIKMTGWLDFVAEREIQVMPETEQ
jgi:hypothetical protein